MSSLEYFNNLVGMNEIFYESHKRVIERICLELGVEDRVDELIEKYLDNKFKLKAKRDPNKPKRYGNPYTHFCREYRETHPDEKMGFSEMNKMLGAKWNSMSDEDKKKYVDLSNKEKENYEHLMEKYNSEMGFV